MTQVADAGAAEELHRHENDEITVRLAWGRHSCHPHDHLAAQLRGTA